MLGRNAGLKSQQGVHRSDHSSSIPSGRPGASLKMRTMMPLSDVISSNGTFPVNNSYRNAFVKKMVKCEGGIQVLSS